MIEEEFHKAVSGYKSSAENTFSMWPDIVKQYSERSRHYHTLTHLENLYRELQPVRNLFKDWSIVVFSIVYHDFVYKASRSDNEEKSAEVAAKLLRGIAVSEDSVLRCNQFILATKRHEHVDEEIDLFTDADLSILGGDPSDYKTYTEQIRKEYSIYPDILYNPGRKKVLLHFMAAPSIYKSEYFKDRYEVKARQNLQLELNRL